MIQFSYQRPFCLIATFWLSIALLAGCSSRGTAPVYSHGTGSQPASYSRSAETYVVRRGDTLYSIAWRHDLEYRQLAAWNGVRAPQYKIFPGQRLRLKAPKRARIPTPSSTTKSPQLSRGGESKRGYKAAQNTPKTQKTDKKIAIKAEKPPKRLKLSWMWPTNGKVAQTFSRSERRRKGVKIAGTLKQPVVAAEKGKVVYAGSGLVGYGNLVIVKHNSEYLSAYGHNDELLVKEGENVTRGQPVANMGIPHAGSAPLLHFEIRRQGKPVDPLYLLPRRR